MISKTRLSVIGIVVIIFSLIVSVYVTPYFIDVIIRNLSKIRYVDDYASSNGILGMYVFFLAFSIVSFYWNFRMLQVLKKVTFAQFLLHCIIDLMAIPISICLMVFKNNNKLGIADVSSLLNPIALAIVILAKHVVVLMVGKKFGFSKRKRPTGL